MEWICKEAKIYSSRRGQKLERYNIYKKDTETRKLIGQLNWLDTQTRQDLSCNVSTLCSLLKKENPECIKQNNRVVKKAKKKNPQKKPQIVET